MVKTHLHVTMLASAGRGTKETGGEGEERKSGRGGTEGQGSAMTTKGGKPGGGDAAVGVGEGEGGEKKGESSWKVTSAEVI